MILETIKQLPRAALNIILNFWIVRKLFSNALVGSLTIICLVLVSNQGYMYYGKFMELYEELNTKTEQEMAEEPSYEVLTSTARSSKSLTNNMLLTNCRKWR